MEITGLKFASYEIGKLYIKLDKKLSIQANHIVIPKSKEEPQFNNIDQIFDRIKNVLEVFEFISLHDIRFENTVMEVVYADNLLHINTDQYEIAGQIYREGSKFIADVPLLYVKEEEITVEGNFTYDLAADALLTEGSFDALGMDGNFTAHKLQSEVHLHLATDYFDDIAPVIKLLGMKPIVEEWATERVRAKQQRFTYLYVGGSIVNNELEIDTATLDGEAEFREVTVDFRENVPPVTADVMRLKAKDEILAFEFDDPEYVHADLNGSEVKIVEVFGEKPTMLLLEIHAESPVNSDVQKIFHAYGLKIPVIQKSGTAHSDVNLTVQFSNSETTALIDTTLENAQIMLYAMPLDIQSGHLGYKGGVIQLDQMRLHELNLSRYSGEINGSITLKEEQADLTFALTYLREGPKAEYFSLKNKKVGVHVDFSEDIVVKVPELAFTLTNKEKESLIQIDDLLAIKPYVQLPLIEEGGHMGLRTKDFDLFTFEGELKRNRCFLYENDESCQTKVPFEGVFKKGNVEVSAFHQRLKYDSEKSRVALNTINIDLEQFITHRINDGGKMNKNTLVLLGTQSNLRYRKYKLITDSYDVEVKPNGDIKALGSKDNDIVKFTKTGDIFFLQALRIKDTMLHPLIGFNGLQEGRYSIKHEGKLEGEMKGQIIIEGGVMRGFQTYNNLLAFLNTLPALVTLQNPGFSDKGFKIEEGVITYRLIGTKRLIFDSIYLHGGSSTFVGRGSIDLEQQTMQIKLAIRTAREIGKVLGTLPLVGYILLGEDKSMTIGLEINGAIDNPRVTTTAAKDVLTLPLQLIKRTLESPKQLIEEGKKMQKANPQNALNVLSADELLQTE